MLPLWGIILASTIKTLVCIKYIFSSERTNPKSRESYKVYIVSYTHQITLIYFATNIRVVLGIAFKKLLYEANYCAYIRNFVYKILCV